MFVRLEKEWCIMGCCRLIIRISAVNKKQDYNKPLKNRPEQVNGKGVVLYGDNARPQRSLGIQKKIGELGWESLMRLQYCSSGYHLVPSPKDSLNGANLVLTGRCKNYLWQFLQQEPQKFHSDRMMPSSKQIAKYHRSKRRLFRLLNYFKI